MNALPSHLVVRPPAYVRAWTFVWESWKGIDARFLRAALGFALVIGLLLGGSAAILQRGIAWWRSLLSETMDAVIATLALTLCLAVVARMRPARVPRWVPYIAAACVSIVVNFAIVEFLTGPAVATVIGEKAQWPGLTLDMLRGIWLHWPRLVIFCSLGAMGFMFAREARLRTEALRNVQLERAKLARSAFESRLQAMQARVEPRFLFETLAHVERLYERDADAAERMLDDLIVFLRKALPSLEQTTSTVDAELGLARAWLGITKTRLGGRLQFAVTMPDDALRVLMPPMILLPVLERSVDSMTATGLPKLVEVSARLAGDRLMVTVTDTRPTASGLRAATLAEIRERLDSLYGPRASIEVEEDESTSRTTMEMPHERSDGDHR